MVEISDENLEKVSGGSYALTGSCNGCGACAANCPIQVITLCGNSISIGPDCFGCGLCRDLCPTGAISAI